MLGVGFSAISQAVRFTAPLTLLLAAIFYLTTHQSPSEVVRGLRNDKSVFVDDVLADRLDSGGGNGGSAIAEVCASRNWTAGVGVYFGCEAAAGGVGQVRSAHLTCVRLAIEAGAELILPRIVRRPDKDRSKIKPDTQSSIKGEPMSYFFDEDHVVTTLNTWCPQLKVHRSLDDLYAEHTLLNPHKLDPLDILGDSSSSSSSIKDFAAHFYAWLDRAAGPPAERRMPLRIEMAEARLVWPVETDRPRFNRQFGALLRTRQDTRRLAATVLYNLGKTFGVVTDPRDGWQPDSFVGVDLRTAYDAPDCAGFQGYTEQAAHYLTYLLEWRLPAAYLGIAATRDDAGEFTRRAADFNVTVVRAGDLLDTAERRTQYAPLSWDQRMLVDYEVLRRAGRFVGPSAAEFAWDVAVRRHFGWNDSVAEAEAPVLEKEEGSVRFRDDFSALYGVSDEGAVGKYIWP